MNIMSSIKKTLIALVFMTMSTALTGCSVDHTILLNVDEDGDGQKEQLTVDISSIDDNSTEVTISRDDTTPVDSTEPEEEKSTLDTKADTQKRIDFIKGLQSYLELHFMGHREYPIQKEPLEMQAKNDRCLGNDGFTKTACNRDFNMELYHTAPDNFSYTYQSTDGVSYTINYYLLDGTEKVYYVATPSGMRYAPPADTNTEETGSSTAKARDDERLSEVRRIQTFLELFYSKNAKYPLTNTTVNLGLGDYMCLGKDGFGPIGCEDPFLAEVPSDPLSPESDYTYISTNEQNYKIYFNLETDETSFSSGRVQASPSGMKNN